jgi:hypothetical protein
MPSFAIQYGPSGIGGHHVKPQARDAIVESQRPMTVRQVYYRATVAGVVEKTELGYTKVQTALADMRRARRLPYDWLADSTRWMRKPTRSFGSNSPLAAMLIMS